MALNPIFSLSAPKFLFSFYCWKPLASVGGTRSGRFRKRFYLGSHLLTSSWWRPWATGFSAQVLLLYPGAEELDFKGLFCFQFSFGCLAGVWRPETCKKLTLSTGPFRRANSQQEPTGDFSPGWLYRDERRGGCANFGSHWKRRNLIL